MEVRLLASCPNLQTGGPGYPFLFVIVTFDLSGMGDPTSSNATVSVALRMIWSQESHHCNKVDIPSDGESGNIQN